METDATLIDALLQGNFEQAQSIISHDHRQRTLGLQVYLACLMVPDAATSLIDSGHLPVDVPDRSAEGYTALHYAAAAGNLQVAEFLLGRGADVQLEGNRGTGRTPLFLATTSGKLEIVKLLVTEGGANPDTVASLDPVANPESKASLEWLHAVQQQRKEVLGAVQKILGTFLFPRMAADVGRLIVEFSYGWIPRHGLKSSSKHNDEAGPPKVG